MVDFALTFPPGFLWGTATAAHQVEGSQTNNTWAAWEETPGHIFQDQRAGLACDWWNGRYVEDFDRAAWLGNNTHRFSVEWSRIEPEPGRYDESALAHYADMIAALRARRMEPLITLHHFTDPLWISERGGWTNPETIDHFAAFAQIVAEALGASASLWCTINEPLVYATHGYLMGNFPPGQKHLGRTLRVVENLLRGHAAAYAAIKEAQPGAQIGFAKHQVSLVPRRPALLHTPARNLVRQVYNQAFVDALLTGVLKLPRHTVHVPQARGTLDWIGLNYYYRFEVGFSPRAVRQLFVQQRRPSDGILGPDSVGEIWPEGLFEQIRWLGERTDIPIFVTENGIPDADDALRPLFLVRSIRSLWQAVNFNYQVKGYFFWSLLDNFEWAEGYDPQFRFGLFGCDPVTQERTRRPSADLYRAICTANALTADTVRAFLPDDMDRLFPGVAVQSEVDLPPRP